MTVPETSPGQRNVLSSLRIPDFLSFTSALSPRLGALLDAAAEWRASDLFIKPGECPKFRLSGSDVSPEDATPLSTEDVAALVWPLLNDSRRQELSREGSTNLSVPLPGRVERFRVNVAQCHTDDPAGDGIRAVFRLIPGTPPELFELGFNPEVLQSMLQATGLQRGGLVLVSGITGSGKSTTLAAMLNHINRNRPGHLLTIEDPIEFVHKPHECVVTQREVGIHVPSFKRGLEDALRQAPNYILVGEMRKTEEFETAIQAAETGHLVFATVHSGTADGAVKRILDAFDSGERPGMQAALSQCLRYIFCQHLVPTLDGGRVAAHEVMVTTPAVAGLIADGKIGAIQNQLFSDSRQGSLRLDASLLSLFQRGVISAETAVAFASDRKTMEGMLVN